jgi:hypothetical protein
MLYIYLPQRRMTMTTEASKPEIRILKRASCPSLSGKSELAYSLACDAASEIMIRIDGNSGGGYFNREWISFTGIMELINQAEGPFNGFLLHPLFPRKSINSSFFVLAVLKAEGILQREKRCYLCGDTSSFTAKMKALIATKDALKAAPPKKKSPTSSKKKPSKPAPAPL